MNPQLGANTHVLGIRDKVNTFCKKLKLWWRNLKQKSIEVFANVDESDYKVEEQPEKVVFATIENDLDLLANNCKKYFLAEDKLLAGYK